MAEQTETEDRTCAVCGRRLLLGERSCLYVNREGNEALVCELCKARAEASGWKRPEEVSVPDRATGGRRRRGRGDLLGGLLSRAERELVVVATSAVGAVVTSAKIVT